MRGLWIAAALLAVAAGCREVPPDTVSERPVPPGAADKTAPPAEPDGDDAPVTLYGPPSFSALASRVAPSVVSIFTLGGFRDGPFPRADDDGFRTRLGSGFVVDTDGYVLTSARALGDATSVMIGFHDGRETAASIVGIDRPTDLAVLRVDALGYTIVPARLAADDSAAVGDWVVAIGNPYGLSHTVTAGIVSATGRTAYEIPGAPARSMFMQTDAAINPGNAGGPLIDERGDVVGVCADIDGPGRGIGFAVPVALVRRVFNELKEKGRVERSYLGVYVRDVSAEIARASGLARIAGAFVTDTMPSSPASAAGLRAGDVILELGGKPVGGPAELSAMTEVARPGEPLAIVIWRDKGEKRMKIAPAPLPELPD